MAPALASALGPLAFLVLTASAHVLRREYDWVRQTISELALGPNAGVALTSFILFAGLIIVLALKLESSIQGQRGLRTSIVLLILIGVGFLLIGIFPTDLEGSPLTVHNMVHQGTVRVLAALFPLSCFLIARSIRADPGWRRLYAYTMITGALGLALDLSWVFVPADILHPRLGLYERVLAGNSLIWMEVVAINMLVISRRSNSH